MGKGLKKSDLVIWPPPPQKSDLSHFCLQCEHNFTSCWDNNGHFTNGCLFNGGPLFTQKVRPYRSDLLVRATWSPWLNWTYLITFLFLPCGLTDCVMTTGILMWPPTGPAVFIPWKCIKKNKNYERKKISNNWGWGTKWCFVRHSSSISGRT